MCIHTFRSSIPNTQYIPKSYIRTYGHTPRTRAKQGRINQRIITLADMITSLEPFWRDIYEVGVNPWSLKAFLIEEGRERSPKSLN